MWKIEENESTKLLGLFRRYSLLEFDEASGRYSLHDLLTDYALSQMEQDEKIGIRISHAVHYSQVLGQLNQLFLKGGDNLLVSLKNYDIEWANIEFGQHVSSINLEVSQSAAEACNWYAWQGSINNLRLLARDQIKWIEDGLRASKVLKNKEAEGAHLGNLGIAHAALGDAKKAIDFYEQSLEIKREIGDRRGEAFGSWNLGQAYEKNGELEEAIRYMQVCVDFEREIGHPDAEKDAQAIEEIRKKLK